MKRTLSLLLGLSLLGAASVVAQEAKKDAPKKAAAPAVKLPAQKPDVAAPKFDPKTGQVQAGFAKAHESFVTVAKKGEAQVVFLGDSITAGWNGHKALFEKEYGQYKAANFGIGGDQVQHVLWRVENGEFEGIKPKAVNALIAKFDDGQKVRYLDIGAKFLTADGTLEKSVMPDLLHLNAVSYQIWADAIREPLAALVR
jgi:N-acetylglucosamine-6-sulfatase